MSRLNPFSIADPSQSARPSQISGCAIAAIVLIPPALAIVAALPLAALAMLPETIEGDNAKLWTKVAVHVVVAFVWIGYASVAISKRIDRSRQDPDAQIQAKEND